MTLVGESTGCTKSPPPGRRVDPLLPVDDIFHTKKRFVIHRRIEKYKCAPPEGVTTFPPEVNSITKNPNLPTTSGFYNQPDACDPSLSRDLHATTKWHLRYSLEWGTCSLCAVAMASFASSALMRNCVFSSRPSGNVMWRVMRKMLAASLS